MTINVPGFRRRPVHPHVHDIVGVFTSLTLLELDGFDGAFGERARRIQRRLWEDLDHSDYTGVEVIRDLARSHMPIPGAPLPAAFPVVFTSLLFAGETAGRDRPSVRPGEPSAEVVFEINQSPQVWLSAEVAEEGGGLAYRIDAVDELFPDGLLEDLFAAWGRRLDALACEPGAWKEDAAATADSLLPAWQREARDGANSTEGPVSSMRLEELFDRTLAAPGQPERIAVVARDRQGTYHELTYAELDRRAEWVAAALSAAGVIRGERVAVVMEKGWETAAAVLGVLRAGAAYLPLEPELPPDRLRYLVGNASVRVALTTRVVRSSFAFPDGVRAIEVDPSSKEAAGGVAVESSHVRGPRSPDDVAYVLYTSGSTGQPKGVVISHRGAVNTVLDVNERFALGPEDRILGLSALGFDLSVWDLFGAFAAGAAVVLPEEAALKDPARWLDPIERAGVTVWDSVPALMKLFLESGGARVDERPDVARRLRLVMLSGDWTPVTLPGEIRRVFPDARVVSLGGATEASIWSIAFPIERADPAWRSIPYGRPLRNQRFHVLDRALAPRPVWVPGDLYIAGTGLALGYLADDEKTRASFFAHPRTKERLYRTGDIGRYLPDGTIEFLGRDDRQVKVLGTRMELGEIEAALADHPGIASAVVIVYGEWNRHLCAYVVRRRPADARADAADRVDAADLRSHLVARLPAAMVPEAYVFLSAIPLTANGKVDRSALPLPAERPPAASAPLGSTFRSSDRAGRLGRGATPVEIVAAAVAGILRVPAVDPGDNLIELGANSIDFIRIANMVERTCGGRPAFDEIYRQPTVAAIVRAASRSAEDEVPLLIAAFPRSARGEGRLERWEDSE
jgi:amino acid adenylation domain-containing protein